MKTEELIRKIKEIDPSGSMDVVLAVDSGEGYVGLDTVFADMLRKQPVDGDELDCSSSEVALFLGDGNAEPSPAPVFRFVPSESSRGRAEREGESELMVVPYGTFKEGFEAANRLSVPLPPEHELMIHLDDREQRISLSPIPSKKLGKFVDEAKFGRALEEHINSMDLIQGKDGYDEPAAIERIERK